MNNINLFCLPFAGGSVYSYRNYVKLAPAFLKVIPIELPGRGHRVREKLLTDIELVVEDIFQKIKNNLNEPYAIYGHSMGTLLGYLVTQRIIKEGYSPPSHLFFTGCRGPSVTDPERHRYLLPKDQFLDKIRELGGSPDEILNDDVLMEFFEPILRADFEVIEKYNYEESEPLDIPITVINGLSEKATYNDGLAWQKETTEKVEVRQFPGKHFFIFGFEHEILKIIVNKLNSKILVQ